MPAKAIFGTPRKSSVQNKARAYLQKLSEGVPKNVAALQYGPGRSGYTAASRYRLSSEAFQRAELVAEAIARIRLAGVQYDTSALYRRLWSAHHDFENGR